MALKELVPDKPTWYARLEEALSELEQVSVPWIDALTLGSALRVSQRRAQQILRPLVRQTMGRNGLAKKEEVLQHLRRLAAGDDAEFEVQRRQRLHASLTEAHQQMLRHPPVFVEAPSALLCQALEHLPSGVHLSPGRIVIEHFTTPEEAKQLLLSLILAMGNNPDGFDRHVTKVH